MKNECTSKPLGSYDSSGFEFVKEILNGDPTYGINFDRIQWDNKYQQYVIVEFLLCEENQTVTPYTSHPNRYFHKNKQKFISLWVLAKKLGARLYLVNYARKGTKHENEVLFMHVQNVNEHASDKQYVVTIDTRLTREDFAKLFREMNLRGETKLP